MSTHCRIGCAVRAVGRCSAESGDRYRCTSLNLAVDSRVCTYGKVYKSSVEPVVWAHLHDILQPVKLEQGAKRVEQRALHPVKRGRATSRFDEIEREIERLKNKIATLMDNFSDDDTLAAIAAEKMRTMSHEIQELELERGELQENRRDAVIDAAARASAVENAPVLLAMVDDPDEEVRRRVLDALNVRVEMRSGSNGQRGIVIETVFGRSRIIPIRHNPGRKL